MRTLNKKIKIFLLKIYKLINFIIFLPMCLLIILINPLIKIRFYAIDYFLGSSDNLKQYLCQKKIGLEKKYIDLFFIHEVYKIFFLNKNISNIFWMKLISKKVMFVNSQNRFFFLIYNFIIKNICDIFVFLKLNNFLLEVGSIKRHFNNKKVLEIYDKLKTPLMPLSKEDLSKCIAEYKKLNNAMDVKPDQEIVTFCNRDGAYKKYQLPNINLSYHDFRNFSVQDYEISAKNMVKKNLYLIRMGNITETKFNFEDRNFFDYSKSNYVSPYMDIYLIYKSKFFIGPESGLDKVAYFFYKPIVLVNVHHLIDLVWRVLNAKDIFFIPQKLFDQEEGKNLTFTQMLDPNLKESKLNGRPVGLYTLLEDYKNASIKVVNNTPEEINNVVEEMNLHLNGKLELSSEDIKLQKEFWKKFSNEFSNYQGCKISPSFLRNNLDLLE